MSLSELYKAVQGNYDDVMELFGSEATVERFLFRFPEEPTMQELRDKVAAGDIEGSFKASHTLKGLAANLHLEALREAASDLTEQVRGLDQKPDEALVAKLEETYQMTANAIMKYREEKNR